MYTLHRLYWVAVGGGEREHRYAMDYIFYASVPGQAPSFTGAQALPAGLASRRGRCDALWEAGALQRAARTRGSKLYEGRARGRLRRPP